MFVCQFCMDRFDTGDELVDHLNFDHDAYSALTFMEVEAGP